MKIMKTLKKFTKTLVRSYINGMKESANIQYGYMYRK